MTDERVVLSAETEEALEDIKQPPPKREFTLGETVLSWLSLAAGYAFCRVFPVTEHPLGGLLFVLAVFAVGIGVLWARGHRPTPFCLVLAAAAVVVSLSLFLSSTPLLHLLSFTFALAAFALFTASATGNTSGKLFSDSLLADFIMALIVMPLCSFGKLFSALFSGRLKGCGRIALKLLAGVVITVVPTVIVLSLLSYDSGFTRLMERLFDFDVKDIFSHILSLICGIPVGMYIFGMFISAFDKTCENMLSSDSCSRAARGLRFVPAATAVTAALPPLFIYVVYFISQWGYYISGFTGVLPNDMTYAEYAREGFFQLCTVSVINLIVIILLNTFMRRKDEKAPVLLRVITVVYSVFTLALISTAIAKMVMYINSYGLTHKRVYSSWLMGVLAIIFVLVIVKQAAARIKLIPIAAAVTVACFAGLSLCNVDSVIAGYNVDRYLAGDLKTVDVYALEELGDAAVPELVRLARELDKKNGTDISVEYLNSYLFEYGSEDVYESTVICLQNAAMRLNGESENGIFTYTVPKLKAIAALQRIEFIE